MITVVFIERMNRFVYQGSLPVAKSSTSKRARSRAMAADRSIIIVMLMPREEEIELSADVYYYWSCWSLIRSLCASVYIGSQTAGALLFIIG